MLSREDTDRVAAITRLLRRATDTLGKARCIDTEDRAQLKTLCREVVVAYEEEQAEALVEAMRQVVRTVRDRLSTAGEKTYEVLLVYVIVVAIGRFINSPVRQEESPVAQEIFLTVCLGRLAALIREIDDRD